jgi:hypothetical protein
MGAVVLPRRARLARGDLIAAGFVRLGEIGIHVSPEGLVDLGRQVERCPPVNANNISAPSGSEGTYRRSR